MASFPESNGDAAWPISRLESDYDGDGKSNIVELQNNTDPTDGAGNTPATDAVDDLSRGLYFAE